MDRWSESAEAMPLVTVVTTTLNLVDGRRIDVFKRCVESVRQQSYGNIEHIIIDGASQDGTLDIIHSLGLTVYSESDEGIYDAFNKGIRWAKGVYVAYLNSDDFFCTKDAVKLSVDALRIHDADWSYGHAYWLTRDGRLCFWEGTLRALPFGALPCHQTVFVKKSVLEALHGFDLNYRNVADNLMMMRLYAGGYKSVNVNAPLVFFKGGGASEAMQVKADNEYVENFHALYGKICNLSLTDCAALYGGRCFATRSSDELVELGLRLRYPEWIGTFFEMTYNIRGRLLPAAGTSTFAFCRYYLFGIPFLKRLDTPRGLLFYLFGKILVLRIKLSRKGTEYHCLFGWLPILKIKRSCCGE